jgi:hypothetical protein
MTRDVALRLLGWSLHLSNPTRWTVAEATAMCQIPTWAASQITAIVGAPERLAAIGAIVQ